uniref:SANT domain-containing protein n=1 Tax=Rhabditophanes sp. KR3021 TaxID=114890 RepID=A0AC35TJC5_9BILA
MNESTTESVSRRRKVFKNTSPVKGNNIMMNKVKQKEIKQNEKAAMLAASDQASNSSHTTIEDRRPNYAEKDLPMDLGFEEGSNGLSISCPLPLESVDGVEKIKKNTWSPADHNTFYDAIKANGKDFDLITKYMHKKKVAKDVVQVRSQWHNLYRIYKSHARITDQEIQHIPREVRELFIIINGIEWKKKVGDLSKNNAEKFRKLIGTGYVHVRKKTCTTCIKTPVCPALLKLLPEHECPGNVHEHLFIHLFPRRSVDYNYVKQSCGQNPRVVIKFHMEEKIQRIFDLLSPKWKINHKNIEFRIAPTEKMVLKDYSISFFSDGSLKKISLNKILSRKGIKPFRANNDVSVGLNGNPIRDIEPANESTIGTKDIFFYDKKSLEEGISNVDCDANAKVSELYFLCGRQEHIEFYYALNLPDTVNDLWHTFATFMKRKYGGMICGGMKEHATAVEDEESGSESDESSQRSDKFEKKRRNTERDYKNSDQPSTSKIVQPQSYVPFKSMPYGKNSGIVKVS